MSKRKQHSATKRLITQTLIAVKDLALTMKLSRSEKVDLVSCKTKKRVKALTPVLAQALGDTAFKWSILLVVWAKESNGKIKTKVDFIKTVAYRHEDLTEYLRREHKALIDSCKAEILDAGWVAMPNGWTTNEDEILTMFDWSED